MSNPLGSPVNHIARSPSSAREQYPSPVQEHYSSPVQEHYWGPASSPSPNPISIPSDGPRRVTIASQPIADRFESDKYVPDETCVDLHDPVQEEKNTVRAANAPSEPRRTGAEDTDVLPAAEAVETRGAEIKLSQKRKWFLLLVFSVAQVCDRPSRLLLLC